MKRTAILAVLIVIVLSCAVVQQYHLYKITGLDWKKEGMTYLPGDERIKTVLLGFESTAAHYLWIRTVLYFGGHFLTDKDYPWLIRMLDIITRLDPYFYPPYEFAGILVPDVCKNPDAARVLLQRGLSSIGNRKWNIPFYLGMIYLKYYNDKETAARYFAVASQVSGPHSFKLARLTASMYNQIGQTHRGFQYLKFMYETSESPEVKQHILEEIVSYQNLL